ncbi:MAG: hypothetical protein EOO90_09530 [Pedobacter sp.]|nr:MAG: hypothetical protein EOO90_09530 [Pedobacter sp.]
MRKLILMVLVASAASIYQPAKAQVSLHLNIGAQPNWGPRGYNHVDYYYLPDIQSYYYVPTRQFIYLERNRWVHRKSLPARYRAYNLHQGRKIVINQPRPYLRHDVYARDYQRGRGFSDDRYSRGRYHKKDRFDNKKHKKMKDNRGHRNGRH